MNLIVRLDKKKNSTWMLGFFLCLSACATAGNPSIQKEGVHSKIKVGSTTKAEVREMLGEPTHIHKSNIGGTVSETWAYGYSSIRTNPMLYVPIAGLFASDTVNVESKGFSVTFSPDGIVQGTSFTKSDVRGGGLFNPTEVRSETETEINSPND